MDSNEELNNIYAQANMLVTSQENVNNPVASLQKSFDDIHKVLINNNDPKQQERLRFLINKVSLQRHTNLLNSFVKQFSNKKGISVIDPSDITEADNKLLINLNHYLMISCQHITAGYRTPMTILYSFLMFKYAPKSKPYQLKNQIMADDKASLALYWLEMIASW